MKKRPLRTLAARVAARLRDRAIARTVGRPQRHGREEPGHRRRRPIGAGGSAPGPIIRVNKKSARKVRVSCACSERRISFTRVRRRHSPALRAPQPCAARPAFADASSIFGSRASRARRRKGMSSNSSPELVAEQLVIRATAYRVRLPDDRSMTPTDVAGFHALYTTRAPRLAHRVQEIEYWRRSRRIRRKATRAASSTPRLAALPRSTRFSRCSCVEKAAVLAKRQ